MAITPKFIQIEFEPGRLWCDNVIPMGIVEHRMILHKTGEKLRLIILFCLMLALSCPAQAATRNDGREINNDQEYTLLWNGLKRHYFVHWPEGNRHKRNLPVVLALHGGAGNAEASINFFNLSPMADKEGFMVVYPEGTGRRILGKLLGTWNAGRCCGPAQEKNVDDVGFISAVIDRLKKDFDIDQKRVYVTGMSNGALMAYRLACELSEKIAAIAPGGAQDSFDDCRPSRPVPVIHFHGTADPCALYNGGGCGGCSAEILHDMGAPAEREPLWQCRSVPDYVKTWGEQNGCNGEPRVTFERGSVRCETYSGSPTQAEVTLCTANGMGHNWLGRDSYGTKACLKRPDGAFCRAWGKVVGPLNTDADANDLMWDFFKKHRLP